VRVARGAAIGFVLILAAAAVSKVDADTLCPGAIGTRVVLASQSVDPDVFVWDSRFRMIDYEGGQWGASRSGVTHTMLIQPGTTAYVISCFSGSVHPKFSGDEDAVGLKVTSGPYRGRYGWVASGDTHVMRSETSSTR